MFRQYHSNNGLRIVFEGTFRASFNDDRVRDRVADAVMAEIRRPPYNAGTITAVSGTGASVKVELRP